MRKVPNVTKRNVGMRPRDMATCWLGNARFRSVSLGSCDNAATGSLSCVPNVPLDSFMFKFQQYKVFVFRNTELMTVFVFGTKQLAVQTASGNLTTVKDCTSSSWGALWRTG